MTKQLRVLCLVILALATLCGTVSAYSADENEKQVTVITADSTDTYTTTAQTVEDFLEEVDIDVKEEDILSPSRETELKEKNTITITEAFPVVLEVDGSPRMIYTTSNTIGECLDENKDSLPAEYTLEGASTNDKLKEKMTISVTTAKETVSTQVKEIPYETEEVENDKQEKGTRRVKQAGQLGQSQITVTTIYEGGKLVSSETSEETVLKAPVTEIIEIGTKEPEVATASTSTAGELNGIAYTAALQVQATGYTPYDAGCTGITATGTKAGYGTIAVDPSVIPFGTQLYIPGYGYGVAADTGGAIKGNKIDLCYETKNDAFSWGRRSVTIYILE